MAGAGTGTATGSEMTGSAGAGRLPGAQWPRTALESNNSAAGVAARETDAHDARSATALAARIATDFILIGSPPRKTEDSHLCPVYTLGDVLEKTLHFLVVDRLDDLRGDIPW